MELKILITNFYWDIWEIIKVWSIVNALDLDWDDSRPLSDVAPVDASEPVEALDVLNDRLTDFALD